MGPTGLLISRGVVACSSLAAAISLIRRRRRRPDRGSAPDCSPSGAQIGARRQLAAGVRDPAVDRLDCTGGALGQALDSRATTANPRHGSPARPASTPGRLGALTQGGPCQPRP